jgi:hypothetical protein
MPDENFKRKLTATLIAEVEDCSRLMDRDAEATPRNLTACSSAMTTLIQQHRG